MTISKRRTIGLMVVAASMLVVLIHSNGRIAAEPRPGTEEVAKDTKERSQLILRDDFDGKLTLNWKPVRFDHTHLSVTKNPGKLTITTQRGSIFGDETHDAYGEGVQAKNLFLIENPLANDVDFVVTTSVSDFTPQTTFQQAGLLVYDDDDNYLKWGYEFNWPKGEGQTFVMVWETGAVADYRHVDAESGLKRFWLRLTKRGNSYEYAASTDGDKFTIYGEKTWDGRAKRIGLIAKNGGNKDAPDIDVAFDFFELKSPVPPALADAKPATELPKPSPAPSDGAKAESPPVYDEKADGAEQIEKALANAKLGHKHVLLQFGANWCGWCLRLHKLMDTDQAISDKLKAGYVVVLIDVNGGHNQKIDAKYGNPSKLGLPAIVVLDDDGKLLTTKDSDELEEGDHHNPRKSARLLERLGTEEIGRSRRYRGFQMSVHDPLDQLRKLAALKDDGIVDVDEFNRMKAELLARVSVPPTTATNAASDELTIAIPTGPIMPPPIESRITQSDVNHWKDRLASCESEYQQHAKQREYRRKQLARLGRQIRYFNAISWTRSHFRNVALGSLGPIVVCTSAGAFLGVVISSIFSESMFIGGLVGTVFALVVSIHVFAFPDTRVVERKLVAKGEELKSMQLLWNHEEPAFEEAKARAVNARRDYDSVLAQFHSRRNQLLNLDWRLFRGDMFEEFLKNIFECLGYQVKRIGRSGDQGVDLVVEKNGARLAVQAKGYANNVSNDAVQQAHAGLTFHRCNRCAVITNSTFTPSAIELARRVGCVLIDGSQINALIFGKIEL